MNALNSDKYAFLRMEAPTSYVAGLGRGASGFTTRSDIGPAREGPTSSEAAAAAERGENGGGGGDDDDGDDGGRYQDPENETGLFAGTPYDADDQEADNIYDSVEKKMDERRRARREKREREEEEKARKERPPISEQFSDLKRGLSAVSEQEWTNLPEVANLTGKRRKKMEDRHAGKSFIIPDSVLVGARTSNQYESSIDESQMNGLVTPAEGGSQNLVEIGEARNKVLGLSLDKAQESGTSTSIDTKGYLTDLDSIVTKSQAEIGDTKRARTLFASLIKSNPKHAPGWIAAASLESIDGRMVAARKLIAEGCAQCPKSEEIWLAAASMNVNENAKVVLANAVQHLPQSVNIWLAAADLEGDTASKKRVLRKALEYIPTSVKLWKAAVSLEEQKSDARALLSRAVELIPLSIELWLTLARLETPVRAKQVLRKAHKAMPTSHEIWIAACRLQEQEDEADKVDAMMAGAVANLKKNGVELPREEWMKEAYKCETNGSVVTCQAIIKSTIFLDVDEEDRYDKWLEDADTAANVDGKIETARAIYAYALQVFPQKSTLWNRAADLEKKHGSREAQLALLARAVQSCPNAEILWLKMAKECWLSGDVPRARQVLHDAFAANPENEQIWLAAVKLEAENNELNAARALMLRARTMAGTDRIWMKSAAFERQHGSITDALQVANEALAKYPSFDKLYMIKGQILQSQSNTSGAREVYALGCKKCPTSVPLWILSSRLEEGAKLSIKARALLEKGRFYNKKSDEIWLESVRVEERAGNIAQAKSLMSRGLQECPVSGLLWSESVWMEPRPARKTKMLDALKKANNDPLVVLTIARVFWSERKLDKARSWLEKASVADPDIGDIWAWYCKFELQHGTAEQQDAVVQKCVAAEPKHGQVWPAIAKDPKNSGLQIPEVLRIVASTFEKVAP